MLIAVPFDREKVVALNTDAVPFVIGRIVDMYVMACWVAGDVRKLPMEMMAARN
jgi:hypothetical protein